MSKVPADLRYAKSHEWVRVAGEYATVGITDHAQHELTDIVFVELPKQGRTLKAGE
jgi:glycine cleavage system H protein